jgi:hypothetical protein
MYKSLLDDLELNLSHVELYEYKELYKAFSVSSFCRLEGIPNKQDLIEYLVIIHKSNYVKLVSEMPLINLILCMRRARELAASVSASKDKA